MVCGFQHSVIMADFIMPETILSMLNTTAYYSDFFMARRAIPLSTGFNCVSLTRVCVVKEVASFLGGSVNYWAWRVKKKGV